MPSKTPRFLSPLTSESNTSTLQPRPSGSKIKRELSLCSTGTHLRSLRETIEAAFSIGKTIDPSDSGTVAPSSPTQHQHARSIETKQHEILRRRTCPKALTKPNRRGLSPRRYGVRRFIEPRGSRSPPWDTPRTFAIPPVWERARCKIAEHGGQTRRPVAMAQPNH